MFVRSARLNVVLSIIMVFAAGVGSACSGGGLGCGCASLPLPPGGLPADQTVEGGAQIRITPTGMQKINNLVTTLVTGTLGDGLCVPSGEIGNAHSTFGTGAYYCYENDGTCAPGCDVHVAIDAFTFQPVNASTLNMHTQFDVAATIPLDYQIIGIGGSCHMTVNADNLVLDANIALAIDPATGELDIHLANINQLTLNLSFGNCGLVSGLLDLIGDVLDFLEQYLGDFINGLITPLLDDLIQGFLPDPLGIEGMIDIGGMLAGVSPGTEALMEGRIVPGGYVSLGGGGMTLGVITGINADEDTASRTPDLDSEPALCVPPFSAPDFAAPPASLPRTSRNTFALNAAGAFSGSPDPAKDLAMGVSETTLDQFGHHLVSSGGMCLGVGTALASQLNVGTIGLLVQSLAELASGDDDPLLLVTRPQHPLDFTVGDGAATPLLTIGIRELEVDFYAFLYERYTRVFTLVLSLDAGINFTVDNSVSPPTLTPVLTGLTSDDIQIKVINSEFVRETPQDLEAVLPTVFDLALPMLADGIGPISLPDFGGFALTDVSLSKVSTSQDDFLAINASLGASAAMRQAAAQNPHYAEVVSALDAATGVAAVAASTGTARLVSVHTPPPAAVRAALVAGHTPVVTAGEMPTVTIDTDAYDALGRPLEWSYRLNGGIWRPFTQASPLVIADRAFAWQGKYTVELRSRVVDDTRTESHAWISIPVIIDSVGPAVDEEVAWDGDELVVTAHDLVSKDELEYAFGAPGDDVPTTGWQRESRVPRALVESLIVNGLVTVFVKDEVGNVTVQVSGFHGQAGEAGCNCRAAGGPTAGSWLLVLLTAGLVLGRRKSLRRVARPLARAAAKAAPVVGAWFVLAVGMSLAPGCSCSSKPSEQACEDVGDCEGFCDNGDIPFCIDGFCVCSDDIPPGRIGPYSDVAGGPDGAAWVSAYASSHGDLVVARVDTEGRIAPTQWQWVDGVPDGPVEIPGGMIRGGISADGPDVGMYTSIAVAPDGTPSVTYFDRDTGSLDFAQLVGGVWQKHVVEAGVGPIDTEGGTVAGMYTALTVRSDDGRPGVAYLRHVNAAGTVHAEVRWAAAQVAVPTSSADWQFWTVDTADVPPEDPQNPDIFPLPGGLGLFIDAARGPDQAPAIVYYDRAAGDLKLSTFDATGGTFRAPILVDGVSTDAGWSPTVAVDAANVVHVAYVGATTDDLLYVRSDAPTTFETIDNGYRIVGTTSDGLPKPEFHFVGDDATMVLTPGGPAVAYQDATTHELLLASRGETTGWQHVTIAGAEDPFAGAFGFFASASTTSADIVMSTWVIDQPSSDQWVEVFRREFTVQ